MHRKQMKSQSAMEYLMTYGWAILIIAIVLGIMYQLGLFSSTNFGQYAKSGSCQINKVGTSGSQIATLAGECQGLPPQYVAQFSGQSYITTPYMTSNIPAITVAVWFNLANVNAGDNPRFAANGHTDQSSDYRGFQLMVNNGGASGWFDVGSGTSNGVAYWSNNQLSTGKWYFYVGTYSQSSGQVSVYINGVQEAVGSYSGLVNSNLPVAIGYNPAYTGDFVDGFISNVQIYNTSLSSQEISALYDEGIGGAPVRPQDIVAWWPLNGNENDYSGNNYDGTPNALQFSSSWTSGYAKP